MINHFNELTKTLEPLNRKHDLAKVFNDLLTMGICTFHRTNIHSRLQANDELNETLYMETIKPYKRDDLNALGQALGILQHNVLDNPYSDILGEFFMQHITKRQNGQYFTPEPVCTFMATINGLDTKREGQRILDPACGSGRMLLSAAKLNHRNYFFGADSSNTCAKMSTLNFFLNGLNGEVAWMNSLTMEWYGSWHINTNGIGIIPIEKEQSMIWTEAPKPKAAEVMNTGKAKTEPAQQLTLF